jgi:hypothetical protein
MAQQRATLVRELAGLCTTDRERVLAGAVMDMAAALSRYGEGGHCRHSVDALDDVLVQAQRSLGAMAADGGAPSVLDRLSQDLRTAETLLRESQDRFGTAAEARRGRWSHSGDDWRSARDAFLERPGALTRPLGHRLAMAEPVADWSVHDHA